jgi:predicted DCC family thiol-disulfide oxidoreductase YuxK
MRPPIYTPDSPVEGQGERHVVVFDGACGMCRRWIRRLEAWDRDDVVETVPFQDPSVTARFPWIPPGAFEEAVQVVAPDGRTWSGAGAVERLASVLPGGRLVAWVFRLPLARPVADRVYARVAAGRSRSGSCGVHCG